MDITIYENNEDNTSLVNSSKDIEEITETLIRTEQVDAVNAGLVKSGEREISGVSAYDPVSHAKKDTNTISDSTNINMGRSQTNKLNESLSFPQEQANMLNGNMINENSLLNSGISLTSLQKGTKPEEDSENEAANRAIGLGSNSLSGADKFGGIYKKRFRRKRNLEEETLKTASSDSSTLVKSNKSKTAGSQVNASEDISSSAKASAKSQAKDLAEQAKSAKEAAKLSTNVASKVATTSASAAGGAATAGIATVAKKAAEVSTKGLEEIIGSSVGDNSEGGGSGIASIFLLIQPAIILTIIIIPLLFVTVFLQGFSHNSGTGSLTGQEAVIARLLLDQGYSKICTAAIMGNMHIETGGSYSGKAFQPSQQREHLEGEERYNWQGFGLCQWTEGRKNNLCSYCESKGKPHYDEQCQVERIEIENSQLRNWMCVNPALYGVYSISWDEWKAKGDDVEWQCACFMAHFERGAPASLPKRKTEALRIYTALLTGGGQTGSEVADRALAEQGKPYGWGCCGPDAYDCSGLVAYAILNQHTHPWVAQTFKSWPVATDPQPGDICTSGGHCGIYLGNGQMCHAPTFGEVVKIGPVQSGMTIHKYPG